jgi:hypothetical protein
MMDKAVKIDIKTKQIAKYEEEYAKEPDKSILEFVKV